MKIPHKDTSSLFGLSIAVALLRLRTYHEPLERDITCNAVCADEFLAGRALYLDLFHQQSPAMVWTHAAIQTVFGYNEGAIYVLGVIAAIVTMLGVYAAASAGQANTSTGLWAAAFWAAVSGTLTLQANQPNAESYMNACVIWGLAVLMRDFGEGSGLKRALTAGACFALATFYKQVTIVAAPALALAHMMLPPGGNPSRPRAVLQTIVMASVGAVAWLFFFGYYWLENHLETVWDLFVSYNLYYAGSIGSNIILGFNPGRAFPPAMYPVFPLLAVAVLAAALGERGKPSRSGALILALLLACPVMVALPGSFYMHYYQVWLAPLAVAAARVLDGIHSRFDKNFPTSMTASAGALLVLLAALQTTFYGFGPEDWSRTKYGTVFIETRRVGKLIGTLLLPDEKFFVWGLETSLYFYSRRRPATGLVWPERAINKGPASEEDTERLQNEFLRNPPALVAVSPYYTPRQHAFMDWVRERYEPLPDGQLYAPFKLYYHRGGALEKRLTANGKIIVPESGVLDPPNT